MNAIDVVVRQQWLETAADELQPVVREVFKAAGSTGQKAKDWLNGVWLGHALHPALTDVPLGAWTAAVAMDMAEMTTGSTVLAPGADAALAVGLVGAAGAAVTGLTDWSDTEGGARTVGLGHALLNAGATTLMATSLVLRRADRRPAAQAASLLGLGLALASAYLGGHLVFERQIGVDHTAGQRLPIKWIDVMAEADLPENTLRRIDVEGIRVLVIRRDVHVYALIETCAHLGGPLSEGRLEGNEVECPWHGSRYAIDDGAVVCGPSAYPQPALQTRVRNGRIEVRSTSEA